MGERLSRAVTEIGGVPVVPLSELHAAEARVAELEQAIAYSAAVVNAQTSDANALSKGRRSILAEEVSRMRLVALGGHHGHAHKPTFGRELERLAQQAQIQGPGDTE